MLECVCVCLLELILSATSALCTHKIGRLCVFFAACVFFVLPPHVIFNIICSSQRTRSGRKYKHRRCVLCVHTHTCVAHTMSFVVVESTMWCACWSRGQTSTVCAHRTHYLLVRWLSLALVVWCHEVSLHNIHFV